MTGVAGSSLHLLLVTGSMFFCLLTSGPAFRIQNAQTLSAPTSTVLGATAGAPQATSVPSSGSTKVGTAKPDSAAPGNVPIEQLNALLDDTKGTLVSAISEASFAKVVQSLCKEFPSWNPGVNEFLQRNAGRLAAVMAASLTPQCIVQVIRRYDDLRHTLSKGLSDAKLVEVIRFLCELLDGDQLDGEGEEEALGFLDNVLDRLAAMVKASVAPPSLVHVVASLMTRAKALQVRRSAKQTLEQLRDSGASEAREFLAKWNEAQQRAARRFEEAVNGKLVKDPEAVALARRFYDSPWVVREVSEVQLPSKWKENGVSMDGNSWQNDVRYGILRDYNVGIVRRDMTDLECAQACVYFTELSESDIDRLFVQKTSLYLGCRAYVLLGGRTCLLSAEQFSSDQVSPAGAGRIRNLPTPAAVNFCVAAEEQNNLTVASCQSTLTAQYASAGAAQVGALGSQQVLKHVCAEECQSLVQAMAVSLPVMSIKDLRQSWCTVDVVQLVEAHNLQCCGSACGWDARTKTCAGIGLLSKVTREEWFAECCSPSAVMLGSDRDYMCRSASPVIWNKMVSPQKEPQSGALEAFKRGEDIAPNFDGSRRTASSFAEIAASASQQPRATDIFQVAPCALTCAEPTFMKSALLQCSASNSREWVTVNEGVQTCPQAGFMQSQKKKSPTACKEFAVTIPGATHASWQFLPGDKSDEQPHQGRCNLYRNCGTQERIMWAKAKAQMNNDTEVLWSRLKI